MTIVDRAYQPSALTVDVGTTVTWINTTLMPHTATAVGGAFDSGTINGGTRFSFTFLNAGTYLYSCTIHPSMKGTVVVRDAPPVEVSLSRRSQHGELIHVKAARPHAQALLEARAGRVWRTIARTRLNGAGQATLAYSAKGGSRRMRVVVLGLHAEGPLLSRTLLVGA